MIDFEDYIRKRQKIKDKYKQHLIELENKYKIYTSRQINSLEEKAIELKRKRVHDNEIMKLLNLTKYELYKLTGSDTRKILRENIIKDCKEGLSIKELAKKYNYSSTQIAAITITTRKIKTEKEIEKIKELARIGLNKKTIYLVTSYKESLIDSVLKKHNKCKKLAK